MNATRGDEVQFGRAGRAAGTWLLGTGLLAAHVGAYLLAGVGLLLLNLFTSPADLWVDRPLLIWAIVLVAHGILVGAKQVTRSTSRRMTRGGPMPGLTHARSAARRARPGRTSPLPRPIRPRFRPTPVTPLVETRPAIHGLRTRSQDIATRGLAFAARGSHFLALRGRDLWEQRAREVLINTGSRLKEATRQPWTTGATQMAGTSAKEDGGADAENRGGLSLVESVGTRVQASRFGQRQPSPAAAAAVAQTMVDTTPASAAPATGATESFTGGTPSVEDIAPGASSSPWGPLPSWARIRPNGSDEGGLDSATVRGRVRPSPTKDQARPLAPEAASPFGLSARRSAQDEDILLDETPVIAKETEWTWMEAAAASWLARRERQDRPDLGQNAPAGPVDQTPTDSERLQA